MLARFLCLPGPELGRVVAVPASGDTARIQDNEIDLIFCQRGSDRNRSRRISLRLCSRLGNRVAAVGIQDLIIVKHTAWSGKEQNCRRHVAFIPWTTCQNVSFDPGTRPDVLQT